MTVIPTIIPGAFIIEPRIFPDARGYFFESYSERDFDSAIGHHVCFVQDNESRSCRGVVRGLHFQTPPHAQAKLVRVVEGSIIDVAVDLRTGSPAFGRHIAVELSADTHRQLFLPRGLAHGFAVTSPFATLLYKVDAPYAPESDGGIDPYDPDLAIPWPVDPSQAILSAKDTRHPRLSDFDNPFRYEE